jgi:hypothetical protein
VFEFEYRTAKYTATISYYPGTDRIAEIFLDHAKPNSQLAELANTAAILASLLLQHGCTVAEIRHSISGPLAMALALVEEPTP